MPIHKGYPVRFSPKGLADAFDATDVFPGACRILQNLIFDQGNPEIMVARPGVGTALTSFGGFTTPTFVSLQASVGTLVYGWVSSALTAGKDQPFCYNLLTSSFVAITGVTANNVPTSPATSGAWTPPTMAVIGVKLILTHPGFPDAGGHKFGVIDITNPALPVYSSSNVATNDLPGVPTSVSNFNNRAYYSYKNGEYYSDVLDPLTATNAGQVVTLGDTTPILAQNGLPITTSSAGVVQSLIVFKEGSIWQITGDAATAGNPLASNFLTLTTGCSAPRSIVQTPLGIIFAAVDAPYLVNSFGAVGPLTNSAQVGEADIQQPFNNAQTPSRMAATFAGSVYRLCMDTVIDGQIATNDYWFDFHRKRWNGPHNFKYDCACQVGNYTVLSSAAKGAKLYKGEITQTLQSVFNDAGTALSTHLQSASLPKTGHMFQKQVIESTQELNSSGVANTFTITALDELGNTLNSVSITTPNAVAVWGVGVWLGGGLWTAAQNTPYTYTVPWTLPLVFQKFIIDIIATSALNQAIGTHFSRYSDAGYTNQANPS